MTRQGSTAASQRLEALGYAARRRTATDDVPAGQWVSVADLATPEDAANALNALRRSRPCRRLRGHGFRAGIDNDLGRSLHRPGGRRRAAVSVRAGLQPRVTERMRTAEVTWLREYRPPGERGSSGYRRRGRRARIAAGARLSRTGLSRYASAWRQKAGDFASARPPAAERFPLRTNMLPFAVQSMSRIATEKGWRAQAPRAECRRWLAVEGSGKPQ